MSGTTDLDGLRLWFALQQLETKHWHDVDFNGGCCAHELYRDDGLFAVGPNRFQGRQGVKTFYEWRRTCGKTITRHVINNMRIHVNGERRATAVGVITIYRAKGRPPFHFGNVPALVGDFASDCVLDPDGTWRYASHILDPIFIGPDIPLSLAIDPTFLDAASSSAAVAR